MKSVSVGVFILFAFLSSAHAATVTGSTGRDLFNALQDTGTFVDGVQGTLSTGSGDIQCLEQEAASNSPSYSCKVMVEDGAGKIYPILGSADASKELVLALSAAGVKSICNAGSCKLEVQGVNCLMYGTSVSTREYSCDVNG